METRGSWGIVYVAVFFAIAVIAVSYGTFLYEKNQRTAKVVAATQVFAPWNQVSDVATATPNASLSNNVSQDLFAGYGKLIDQGQFSSTELNQMLKQIAQKNITPTPVVPNISHADLTVATSSVQTYLATVGYILSFSQQVDEYEPAVFARVVNGSTSDTKTLAADALLYQRISAALLLTTVPPALANDHLEAAKSVGALARAVADMAAWNGDSIQALVLLDTFNKTETYMDASVKQLVADAETLAQKS